MCLAEQRPFLRKIRNQGSIIRTALFVDLVNERENMLNDAGFLVVGLFDQKRIVLYAFGAALFFFGLLRGLAIGFCIERLFPRLSRDRLGGASENWRQQKCQRKCSENRQVL